MPANRKDRRIAKRGHRDHEPPIIPEEPVASEMGEPEPFEQYGKQESVEYIIGGVSHLITGVVTEGLLKQLERGCKPRGFEAPPCCACRALAKGKNYSHVYATKREDGKAVRYCRCGFCGNTFKVTGD